MSVPDGPLPRIRDLLLLIVLMLDTHGRSGTAGLDTPIGFGAHAAARANLALIRKKLGSR